MAIDFEKWMVDYKNTVEANLQGKFNEAVATENNSTVDAAQTAVSAANQKTQAALSLASEASSKSSRIIILAAVVLIFILFVKKE